MAPPVNQEPDFAQILRFIFLFILDIFVLFTTRIPLNFFRWLVTMVVRGYIFTILCINQDYFFSHFQMDRNVTIGSFFYDFFFMLPLLIFMLWYFFTTLIMFLAPIYSGRGFNGSPSEDFSEINRFIQWRDNKIKYSSYQDAAQLMRDSAVINNLDYNDPEARKVLSYFNSQMKFMSYSDSLKFLRGKD